MAELEKRLRNLNIEDKHPYYFAWFMRSIENRVYIRTTPAFMMDDDTTTREELESIYNHVKRSDLWDRYYENTKALKRKIIDVFLNYGVKHKVTVLPLIESIYGSEMGSLVLGFSIERKGIPCSNAIKMEKPSVKGIYLAELESDHEY